MSGKDIGLGIRLSREEHRRLQHLCQRTGRGKGEVLRALIRLACSRDETNVQLIQQECRKSEDAHVHF